MPEKYFQAFFCVLDKTIFSKKHTLYKSAPIETRILFLNKSGDTKQGNCSEKKIIFG